MVNTATNTGLITQIIGPVVDVEFSNGKLPQIYNALRIGEGESSVVCEVQQLLGNNKSKSCIYDIYGWSEERHDCF